MSEEEIRENYDALIDYNSVFFRESLEFPSFPMSDSGRIHFEEVKNIFVLFQYMFIVTLILGAFGIWYMTRKKSYLYLKLTSILTVVIPLSWACLSPQTGTVRSSCSTNWYSTMITGFLITIRTLSLPYYRTHFFCTAGSSFWQALSLAVLYVSLCIVD